jgi:periplasmic protein TonB
VIVGARLWWQHTAKEWASLPRIVLPTPTPTPDATDWPATHGRSTAPAEWVTPDDYPAQALSRGEQGRVTVDVAFDAYGVPYHCTVVRSSGHADLDAATCRAIASKALTAKVYGSDGRAIASDRTLTFRWTIPQG